MKNKKKHTISKYFKIIIRMLNLLLIIAIGGIFYSLGVATYEEILVNGSIEDFKNRATEEISVDFEYSTGVIQQRVYHIVPRETSYELNDERSVFYDSNHKYLGQTGDIFLTEQSPFPQSFGVSQFVSFYFGGHAAFKSENNTFYEATGMTNDPSDIIAAIKDSGANESELTITAIENNSNYWLNPVYRRDTNEAYPYYGTYYRTEFMGLRVKDVTDEQLDSLINFGDMIARTKLYNYLFFLNMRDKYYCTDLVSRAYQSVLVDEEDQKQYSTVLNDDGFITSVSDIILSNDTYITFYVEIIDDVVHIYHLEDI